MPGRLSGKVALVTGAGRGIGRATAELFAQEGAVVVAADLRAGGHFAHPHISFVTLDVSQEDQWQMTVADILARHRRIDILVNNAGVGGSQLPLADETMESWNMVTAVNQTGVFLGMRAVLPIMRERRTGSIINISSIWGISAVAGAAAYHATKAAVRHLSKHAAVTYAPDNVRVNSIHPGITETPMLAGLSAEAMAAVVAATPLGRMAQPIELANGILFLASDEASFVTGAELAIDGGYLAQ